MTAAVAVVVGRLPYPWDITGDDDGGGGGGFVVYAAKNVSWKSKTTKTNKYRLSDGVKRDKNISKTNAKCLSARNRSTEKTAAVPSRLTRPAFLTTYIKMLVA